MFQMLQKMQNNCLFRFLMFVVENINFKKEGRYSHWQCSQCLELNPICVIGRLHRVLMGTIHITFLIVKGGTRSIHFGQIVSWVLSENRKKLCPIPRLKRSGPASHINNKNCHDDINFCLLDTNMCASLYISHAEYFYKYMDVLSAICVH